MGILSVGVVLLLPHVTPCPSGLRIKSAMTGLECPVAPALWIPAYAGMTVLVGLRGWLE